MINDDVMSTVSICVCFCMWKSSSLIVAIGGSPLFPAISPLLPYSPFCLTPSPSSPNAQAKKMHRANPLPFHLIYSSGFNSTPHLFFTQPWME